MSIGLDLEYLIK